MGIDGAPSDDWAWLHCLYLADREPFTATRAAARLHFSRRNVVKRISELAAQRRPIPVRNHAFITADPTVRTRPDVEQALELYKGACCYPTLHLAIGEVLRTYGSDLTSIALIGSFARGEDGSQSDLDLLVIGPGRTVRAYGRHDPNLDGQAMLTEHAFCDLVGTIERSRRHRHRLHVTTLPTRVLDYPMEIERRWIWGFAEDARVLYDPSIQLRAALMRLRGPRHMVGESIPDDQRHWGEAQTILPDRITEWLMSQRQSDKGTAPRVQSQDSASS